VASVPTAMSPIKLHNLQRQSAHTAALQPALPGSRRPLRGMAALDAAPRAHTVLSTAVQTRPSHTTGRGHPVAPQQPQRPEQDTFSGSWDVLGLGQAMVDFTCALPGEALLAEAPFNVTKGARRVISLTERGAVLDALEAAGVPSQVSPGGSLANTLVAISRLSAAHGSAMRVCMAGCVGTDTLGQYFKSALQKAGMTVQVDEDLVAHTGTVMVLTTPDAQRSFLSFFDSGALRMTPRMATAIQSSRLVLIEGYMLELPGADTWLVDVARTARAAGAQVALTAGDPSVVARHQRELQALLSDGLVDVLFCNLEEATGLLEGLAVPPASTEKSDGPAETQWSACAAAAALAKLTSVVVVTDGAQGACVGALGNVSSVPPHWAARGPVDVCGAGDAYAAGIVYALAQGFEVSTAGDFAARVASAVIARHGAQLAEEDAAELVQCLPDHVVLSPARWLVGAASVSAV